MNMEDFIILGEKAGNRTVRFFDIPFSVSLQDEKVAAISSETGSPLKTDDACEMLFFLGMTTDKPECSEWWGQSERYHYQGTRLFIGDRVGRINIVYENNTMETIPIVMGVNVWPYELLQQLKSNEKGMQNYGGPYPEPFASDREARKLLEESLVLMENDAEKGMKYILGIKTKPRIIQEIKFVKEAYREAGFMVSAVTGIKAGSTIQTGWKFTEPEFYLKQGYYPAMDQLARRLYQFRDEIPEHVEINVPAGYTGPRVRFSGNPAAEIYSNVFMKNLNDMAEVKVDQTGKSHTSSIQVPNFGSYVGLGTYRISDSYYSHMWSRDVGRVMMELAHMGIGEKLPKAGRLHHQYLYDGCIRYTQPHWKRIANGSELGGEGIKEFLAGKENDGHASLMLFIYQLYAKSYVNREWLEANQAGIKDAAAWLFWQIENPEDSNFDGVLYSESEASTQKYGGYDLFSNALAYYALKAYATLAGDMNEPQMQDHCEQYSQLLRKGILEKFTTVHPRYGTIFTDTLDDCWTWEYKRFAPLFVLPDLYAYDAAKVDPEWYEICQNTYKAQKEDYFSYAAGRQMGYGQGYLTETAILLDEYADMAGCMKMAAYFCYHHSDWNYIVPEGVIMHPSGRYWFRNADLGNAVQQGEIIKCGRLLLGLDDHDGEEGLHLIPRLPDGWKSLEVEDYGICTITEQGIRNILVSLKYERLENGYRIRFQAPEKVKMADVRFGPFEPDLTQLAVDSSYPYKMVDRAGKRFVHVDIGSEIGSLDLSILVMQ